MSATDGSIEDAFDIVVVGDDDELIRNMLTDTRTVASMVCCNDVWSALPRLRASQNDALLLRAPESYADELETVALLHEQFPDLAIVVLADEDASVFNVRSAPDPSRERLRLGDLRADLLGQALRYRVARLRLAQSVRQREGELRALFDLNPHPMWVYDADSLKFLAVNQVAIRSYGYTEQEFLAMRITDLRSPEEAQRLRDSVARGLPAYSATGIWTHRKKDGLEIEAEIVAQALPLWGPNARLVQARDVTAERGAIRAMEASERRFRNLFEHNTGFICIHDLDGSLLAINPAAAAALGRNVSELLGVDMRELYAPAQRAVFEAYLARITQVGEDAGFMRVLGRRREELVWQYRNRRYVDADGNSYVMGYAQDVTALRAAEEALKATERRLRTIADTLPLEIVYIDSEERFVFVNEAYQNSFAAEGGDLLGRTVREVVGEERYAYRRPFIERALGGERVQFEIEEGDAERYRCREATFIPERAADGTRIVGMHAMLQDVTARKREHKHLVQLTQLDALTGLMNRVGFHARLNNAIARAHDQGSLLAVFYLDIDHFKRINDTHGHAIGDALITAFAERIDGRVRASDAVARIGGDEFTIFIEGARDEQFIRKIADKLVRALGRPFELQSRSAVVSVGASIGVAMWNGKGSITADTLIARADALLYQAKQSGRNTYRLAWTDPANAAPSGACDRA